MVCRTARACSIFLNGLLILIGLSLCGTGGYLLHILGKYDIEGAPTYVALYTLLSLGVFLTFLACLGLQGSAMRKTKGSEGRGLCLLIIYSILLFLTIVLEVIIAIMIFTWISGDLPLGSISEQIESNERAQRSISKGRQQSENFINCVYDSCCSNQAVNSTLFNPVGCYVNDNGLPNAEGTLTTHKCPGNVYPCDPPKSIAEVCDSIDSSVLNVETCNEGIESFRKNVANFLSENIKPIGYIFTAVGGLQFILFIFAVLQICWCCGESDPVGDWDSDDDEYYDEYGQIVY